MMPFILRDCFCCYDSSSSSCINIKYNFKRKNNGKGQSDIDIAAKTLDLCHRKVHTLVKRMRDQLEELKKGTILIDDVVVRLTGVLALLRYLRECDGKVSWIKYGQTSFPVAERSQLLHAVASSLFEGNNSILYPGKEFDSLVESDELSRLKGLLIWLAWDCDLKLDLKTPFFERFVFLLFGNCPSGV